MSIQAMHRFDRETVLVGCLAACVSILSFLVYFGRGDILLYGDAVAHINIARRVFDSRTPGLLQLGTVWLPLPHLLMIPFLLFDWAWRTGLGGSIPSLIAYIAGVVGIFRLVRGALVRTPEPDPASRIAAWVAAAIYAANPNLLYLQTAAMTESLYLAFFIWAVVFFREYMQRTTLGEQGHPQPDRLRACGLCLAGAALTRYDGWLLTAVATTAVVIYSCWIAKTGVQKPRALIGFVLLTASAPVFWLAYNTVIYRNPLEFANGPYSARAIEQKSAQPGYPPHPGAHELGVAAAYFLKSAQWNMAEETWQRIWVGLLIGGSLLATGLGRRVHPLFLLWMPLPFYTLSIAYGGVPMFLPSWWPFSYYNVRYGLQLLPAFAVFAACVTYFLIRFVPGALGKVVVALPVAALVLASYAGIWRAQPACFREAWINSRTRIALEGELSARLKALPPNSTLLMYLGDHVGALQQAGIPLRRVIQEGNHRTWMQPSDPEGLWERALADPGGLADYVVAIDGDPVSDAVKGHPLKAIARIEVSGHPSATIYQTHPPER